jgi:tRNA-dihydrouridine synthase
MALEHVRMYAQIHGERRAVPELRKHLLWYVKGQPGSAAARNRIGHCESVAEYAEALSEALCGTVRESSPTAI